MLRLSTKGQYGVRAMYEIARGYPETPVTIKEISERQDVSVAYLEQILNKLRKAGLIRSIKGPGGGYILNKSPEKVSIASILNELEGPVALTSCLDPEGGCVRVDSCVTHLLWKALGEQVEAFLKTITLKNLITGDLYKLGGKVKTEVKRTLRLKTQPQPQH
ncbi:MAG: Rrf2 family transcriptional regulator [Nitrospirae bacterium]|jgi:Rrf2 family protein|nr:Rrf2 family transcriptional regulator [Nitrospirota bacterium]MCL5061835.1 Rrf2 family transcriptional regulator [Nitrospirota bacterium]MDA8215156.1 Rrf2 family transcriptional regulator [Nitrospiraceae bacterium]MDA8338268.1 Rrf2 family transcriptional regulator [Nitrospiraceae bacterium]